MNWGDVAGVIIPLAPGLIALGMYMGRFGAMKENMARIEADHVKDIERLEKSNERQGKRLGDLEKWQEAMTQVARERRRLTGAGGVVAHQIKAVEEPSEGTEP